MTPVSIDTETALIQDGLGAPPITCVQTQRPGEAPVLTHVTDAYPVVKGLLEDPSVLLVGHNVAFDLACVAAEWPDLLPAVFTAYDADRVTDTMLRQQLIDLARGEFRGRTDANSGARVVHAYNLAAVAKRLLGRELAKGDDTWRTRYAELRPVPLAWWPEEARAYALADARATLDVWQAQEPQAALLVDQHRQARAGFALKLVSTWGMRTDPERVAVLEARVRGEVDALDAELRAAGLVRADGTRDTKAAQALMLAARGDDAARTPTGGVCLDAEACEDSGDPTLEAYARRSALRTILDKDVPALRRGVVYPDFQVLVETGRTSASGYNTQNVRREPGVRECFVPRPGRLFACADYDGLELRTVAQVCLRYLGTSALAAALNEGRDPHLELGAELLGTTYEDAVRRHREGDREVADARQFAKVGNFGLPGGMGAPRLRAWAKRVYGLRLSDEETQRVKDAWFRRYPEFRDYFRRVSAAIDNGGAIEQLFSGRVRGGVGFTEAANGMFQGLGADATKAALYAVVKACYTGEGPLRGCRVVNYIHDELIVEVPEEIERARAAAAELGRVMCDATRPWLPDVPARTTPLLARCWSKEAKAVRDAEGRLVPWTQA